MKNFISPEAAERLIRENGDAAMDPDPIMDDPDTIITPLLEDVRLIDFADDDPHGLE